MNIVKEITDKYDIDVMDIYVNADNPRLAIALTLDNDVIHFALMNRTNALSGEVLNTAHEWEDLTPETAERLMIAPEN